MFHQGLRNKDLISQKRKFDIHSHSFQDTELKLHMHQSNQRNDGYLYLVINKIIIIATLYHFNLTLSLSYLIVYRFILLSLFYVSRLPKMSPVATVMHITIVLISGIFKISYSPTSEEN